MALFESYERRIGQITPVLEKYGMKTKNERVVGRNKFQRTRQDFLQQVFYSELQVSSFFPVKMRKKFTQSAQQLF